MNTMTARDNENRPRNENTVIIAIKDHERLDAATAFCAGDGDEVDCDCALADEAGVA